MCPLRRPPTFKMFRALCFPISIALAASHALAICSAGNLAIGINVQPEISQGKVVRYFALLCMCVSILTVRHSRLQSYWIQIAIFSTQRPITMASAAGHIVKSRMCSATRKPQLRYSISHLVIIFSASNSVPVTVELGTGQIFGNCITDPDTTEMCVPNTFILWCCALAA